MHCILELWHLETLLTKLGMWERTSVLCFVKNYQRCETFVTETDVTETNCYINDGLTAPSIYLSVGSTVEIWLKGKCAKFGFINTMKHLSNYS